MKEKDNNAQDELNLNPAYRPFTVFRVIELSVCAAAMVIGILYVYAKLIPLSVLLPIYAAAFTAVPVLQVLDLRKSGKTSWGYYIGPAFWGIIALAVIAVTIGYMFGGNFTS